MNYSVAYPAVTQNFSLGTDSKTVLTAVPLLCGPLKYTLLEAYSFAQLTTTTNPGTISVHTSSKAEAGVYSTTLDVSLVNYPSVTHA
jgi:hypothetical protein